MSKTDIWMPLYIADYLADTTRLTTEQHGAYLLLIMDYWRNGPLPDDDGALSQITRMQPASWKKNRSMLVRLFRIEGGEWRHKRIDEELIEAEANAKKYAERAKKAAAKRWEKPSLHDASSNASSTPQAVLDQCTSPSPSSITTSTEVAFTTELPDGALPTSANATRKCALCKKLRGLGIDAAPHLQGWAELLPAYTDAEIIAAAEAAREKKPNERLHLNYLIPILRDRAPPGQATAPPRRQTAAEEREAVSIALTGRKPNHERPIASDAERDITGESTRIA